MSKCHDLVEIVGEIVPALAVFTDEEGNIVISDNEDYSNWEVFEMIGSVGLGFAGDMITLCYCKLTGVVYIYNVDTKQFLPLISSTGKQYVYDATDCVCKPIDAK